MQMISRLVVSDYVEEKIDECNKALEEVDPFDSINKSYLKGKIEAYEDIYIWLWDDDE